MKTKITITAPTMTAAIMRPAFPGAPEGEFDFFMLDEHNRVFHRDYDDVAVDQLPDGCHPSIEEIMRDSDPKLVQRANKNPYVIAALSDQI
jgi:hypothetical protein